MRLLRVIMKENSGMGPNLKLFIVDRMTFSFQKVIFLLFNENQPFTGVFAVHAWWIPCANSCRRRKFKQKLPKNVNRAPFSSEFKPFAKRAFQIISIKCSSVVTQLQLFGKIPFIFFLKVKNVIKLWFAFETANKIRLFDINQWNRQCRFGTQKKNLANRIKNWVAEGNCHNLLMPST